MDELVHVISKSQAAECRKKACSEFLELWHSRTGYDLPPQVRDKWWPTNGPRPVGESEDIFGKVAELAWSTRELFR